MPDEEPVTKRILIADDNLGIIDALTLLFEEVGYAVETTTDAATVLTFANGYPDLLLLDVRMSGADGREICRALKSNELTKHIPVILFSAHKDAAIMAKEAGADDYLIKPFDIEDLLIKVAKYCA